MDEHKSPDKDIPSKEGRSKTTRQPDNRNSSSDQQHESNRNDMDTRNGKHKFPDKDIPSKEGISEIPGQPDNPNNSRKDQKLLKISIFLSILNVFSISINVELPVIPSVNTTFHNLILISLFICIILIMSDVVYYLLKNKDLKKTWQIKKTRIILFVLLSIMVFGAYYFMQPTIKISSPIDDALINKTIDIIGTAKRIPEDAPIWAATYGYPPTNRYYPQSQLIYPDPNGRWSLRDINVGDDTDSGEKFDIVVLQANDKAHEYLSDYMRNTSLSGAWEGLEKIPSGAKVLDRITVTRA